MAREKTARIVLRHPAAIQVDADIELRLLKERHASELFALVDRNREHLRRWLPWVEDTRTVRDTRRFIQQSVAQLRRDDGFQTGIWYQGRLVGVLGYHYWNRTSRKTEIGYWLSSDVEGRGIMTRACKALVDYAFAKLGMNRVEIRAAMPNLRSRAIPPRLGFVQEGVLREGEWVRDCFEDQVVYGLLRKDWESGQGQQGA
ncbi:MAG TPA: GNAT family protein [Thermoplasmata archaeon]|jgi:ribosomal-protein-serine acetyltransferase